MDECEYLDQFLYSPSSSDVDLRQRMSGLCYNEEENNNSNCSTFSVQSLAAQEASSAVFGSESDYGFNMAMHQNFHGIGNPSNGSVPSKLGGPCNVAAPLNGNVSSSLLPYTEVGKSESVSQSFPRDFRALSHVPHSGHFPSYEAVSSVSPGLGRDGIGGFGLREGQYIDDDLYFMENCSSNFSTSISSKGTRDVQNYSLPSLASTCQTTLTTNGFQSLPQTATAAPPGECNGTGKPRVRARRGQATDPHSIAERLRREKIADRMKNLQELLPNPNKTDKASMLDEIIEYVKFLQLQLKVLSMSRLGAAGAVVPLITDCLAEDDKGLLASPLSGQIADIVFQSDEAAFERELVKLMESNVTKAMQFLQTKGLCLMPVALASALSPPRKENENRVHPVPSNGNAVMGDPARVESKNVTVKAEDENKISLLARETKPQI